MRPVVALVWVPLALVLGSSCDELPDIPPDVCGNGIVERARGEECDTHVDVALVDACRGELGEPAEGEVDPCVFRCALESEEHACRYVWETDGSASCPLDWSPGSDGQCRRPSGRFYREPIAFVDVAAGLSAQAADFDGDGVADLLVNPVTDPSVLTYFEDGGSILASFDLTPGFLVAGPLSADLATDTTADLLVAGGPVIVTLRGAPGPSLLPKAYAPFPAVSDEIIAYENLPGLFSPLEFPPPGFDLPLAVTRDASSITLTPIEADSFTLKSDAIATFTGSDFVGGGRVVIADVVVEPTPAMPSPIPDFVVATPGSVLSLPPGGTTPQVTTGLDMGEEIVRLFAVSGGEVPDPDDTTPPDPPPPRRTFPLSVAVTQQGDALALREILKSAAPGAPPVFGRRQPLPRGTKAGEILTVALINGDGRLDVVTNKGVFMRFPTDASDYVTAALPQAGLWTFARVTDLHADGRFEVLALAESGQLEVLLPGTEFIMNPALVEVGGTPLGLAVADFDGDALEDVAVATKPLGEAGPAACGASTDIYVLFGRPNGLPESPLFIGSLDGVENMVPVRLHLPGVLDGIHDLVVETSCSPDGSSSPHVGVFLGSAVRFVASPFSPYTRSLNLDTEIQTLAVGDIGSNAGGSLGPPDGHADLAVVAVRATSEDPTSATAQREVRIVPVTGDADMVDVERVTLLGTTGEKGELMSHFPGVVAADLFSGSPGDEVVLLHAVPSASELRLTILEGGSLAAEIPFSMPELPKSSISRLRALDFDLDGDLDVVAVALPGDGQMAGQGLERTFRYVLVNDGQALTPQPLEVPGATLGYVFDAAALSPPKCEGAISPACESNRGVLYATWGDVYSCPYGSTEGCIPLFKDAVVNGSIAVADFDGDGLEDVAATRPVRTEILRQCSVADLEAGLCAGAE